MNYTREEILRALRHVGEDLPEIAAGTVGDIQLALAAVIGEVEQTTTSSDAWRVVVDRLPRHSDVFEHARRDENPFVVVVAAFVETVREQIQENANAART